MHANSQLCSSRVALFQANLVFFASFLNFWIDTLKLFGRPRHDFAHLDYVGGTSHEICQFDLFFTGFVLSVHFEFWDVFSF